MPPPVNPFGGPPVNQFGTPVNQFGGPVMAPPAGWAPYPVTAPPSPATRQPLMIAAAIGLVVVAVVAAVVVYVHNRHSLALPATADGYPLLTDATFQPISDSVVSQLKADGAGNAIVGFYGTGGIPAAAVLAAHDHGDTSRDLSAMEAGMQSAAGSTFAVIDEPAGKLGGKMQCGALILDQHSVPVCVWSDSDTIGMVAMYSTDAAAAPSVALTFREAVEH